MQLARRFDASIQNNLNLTDFYREKYGVVRHDQDLGYSSLGAGFSEQ